MHLTWTYTTLDSLPPVQFVRSTFDLTGIEGLQPVDPAALAEYEAAMAEVVPQIVADVQRRQQLAAESRNRVLGESSTPDPNNLQPGECGGTSCTPEFEEMCERTRDICSHNKKHPWRQTGGGNRVIRKTNTF